MDTIAINEEVNWLQRTSWSAIAAGVIVGLALEALFNLLGLGLGFSAFEFNTNTLANLGTGSIVWLMVSGVVATLIGGWVAGRLANSNTAIEGALHGLITWSLATLLIFMLMATTAGALLSSTGNIIGQTVKATTRGTTTMALGMMQIAPQASAMVKNIVPDLQPALAQVNQQIQQFVAANKQNVSQPSQNSVDTSSRPQETAQQLQKTVAEFLTADTPNKQALARQQTVSLLIQYANLNQQQAEQAVTKWQQTYAKLAAQIEQKAAKAKQQGIEATEKASNVLASIALIMFFAFLLSAIAGSVGGLIGSTYSRK